MAPKANGSSSSSSSSTTTAAVSAHVMQRLKNERALVNLKPLQRYDAAIGKIVLTGFATLYEMDLATTEWHALDMEGGLFIVQRHTAPYLQLMLLNRKSIQNFVQPVTAGMRFERQNQYMLFQSDDGRVLGAFFHDADMAERMVQQLENMLASGAWQRPPSDADSESSVNTNGSNGNGGDDSLSEPSAQVDDQNSRSTVNRANAAQASPTSAIVIKSRNGTLHSSVHTSAPSANASAPAPASTSVSASAKGRQPVPSTTASTTTAAADTADALYRLSIRKPPDSKMHKLAPPPPSVSSSDFGPPIPVDRPNMGALRARLDQVLNRFDTEDASWSLQHQAAFLAQQERYAANAAETAKADAEAAAAPAASATTLAESFVMSPARPPAVAKPTTISMSALFSSAQNSMYMLPSVASLSMAVSSTELERQLIRAPSPQPAQPVAPQPSPAPATATATKAAQPPPPPALNPVAQFLQRLRPVAADAFGPRPSNPASSAPSPPVGVPVSVLPQPVAMPLPTMPVSAPFPAPALVPAPVPAPVSTSAPVPAPVLAPASGLLPPPPVATASVVARLEQWSLAPYATLTLPIAAPPRGLAREHFHHYASVALTSPHVLDALYQHYVQLQGASPTPP